MNNTSSLPERARHVVDDAEGKIKEITGTLSGNDDLARAGIEEQDEVDRRRHGPSEAPPPD
ncbi:MULTISPECIES: CsbD family protein [Rhodococcus]|uniref:CsbD family protein n=1 Tax=Rhodococcus TaxID=1827 RepID=UPI000C99A135|nr:MULTISPECIES: CsbD family protein [Rhodococcus]PND53556.1 hypothetical protein CQZ88_02740 [Rhodococcus sp. ENV425]WKX01876.1 CsbD family protein [Rhodococcus aetherivorans]